MYISLDLETTGITPSKDKIIEFGAVKFDLKGEIERKQFLIDPKISLPNIITHITGIKDQDLVNAPAIEQKTEEIQEFIGDLPIIGHNIKFDTDFLKANDIQLNNPEYDTCLLSSILLPGLNSYSLEILTTELNLQHQEKHRALDDAIAAMELFLKLTKKFKQLSPQLISRIHELCHKTSSPLKKLLLSLEPDTQKNKSSEKATNATKDQQQPIGPDTKTQDYAHLTNFQQKILETETSGLYETIPPYNSLIKTLTLHADKNTVIALPHKLFREIENQTPDNIAKIDTPDKYLSLKRLEEFCTQNHFENHEFSALIKYLIWKDQTKTGLLSELVLFREEHETIYQVNIDPEIIEPEKEHFYNLAQQKDENNPAICTFNYLFDLINKQQQTEKIKTLIILDFEKLTKDLFFQSSIFLNLDTFTAPLLSLKRIHPDNKSIESLLNKSSILFGLVGILFEKYNDNNPFQPRATISNLEIVSDEWSQIKDLIRNLIEISKELGEIKEKNTRGYLKSWKNKLTEIYDLFTNPELEKSVILIEKNHNDIPVIKKLTKDLKTPFKKTLNQAETIKIVSENLDLNDQGEYLKKLHDLPVDLPLFKDNITADNLEILIVKDAPQHPKARHEIENSIKSTIPDCQGSSALIFNSKEQLGKFTLGLSEYLKKTDKNIVSQMTGSAGKINEKFKENKENSIVFLTPNFWEFFEHHKYINTLFLHKIPFAPPSDQMITALGGNFKNAFIDYQIPLALFSLKKIINRLLIDDHSPKKLIIYDSRIIQKDYCKPFMEYLQSLTTTKTVNIASIS